MNTANTGRNSVSGQSEAGAELAYRALGFLAQEPERIEHFLRETGVDIADLREIAADRGFQLAVLDHLAADEALLLAFARDCGVPPESIGRARHALGGGDFD